jgi:NAD(P)-dependent dehydrogenase (short-subunit alcohol dehydrogenase family)
MMLKDKVAVIYGAGGAIGGAVARAFASEGARVFLTGRRREPTEAVAEDIISQGGVAEADEVDALNEEAVGRHLTAVVEGEGRLDISFNAVGLPNATSLGRPFVEMDAAEFALPITAYATSYFLTARLAARHMIPKRSGVIMTISALPARTGTPMNGGYGPAQAAKEALTRDLSVELAPQGIRVVCLRPHGIPETPTMRSVYEKKRATMGASWDQFQAFLANTAHSRRVMVMDELTHMAVFIASDKASGMTGTTVNLTMGAASD